MKFKNLLTLVIIAAGLLAFAGCGSGNQETISITKKYTPQELKEDLNFLVQTDQEVHPNLFVNTPKYVFDSVLNAAQNELTKPMNSLEFYKVIAPVISVLRDGHTFLGFPYQFRQKYLDDGGKAIPFDIYINEEKIFVKNNYSLDSTLNTNSEIISINSISSHDILKSLSNYTFGEFEPIRYYTIENFFKPYFWAHYGFNGPFDVKYISSINNNQRYTKSFAGYTQSEFDSLFNKSINAVQKYQAWWTLDISDDNEIAIIDINTFGNPRDLEKFRSFLDSSFTVIKQKNIKKLIVDVRNNGGGDTGLVEALVDFLANKPWMVFSKADWKLSSQAKADMIPWGLRWLPIKTFINLFSFLYTSSKIDRAEYDSLDNKLLHVYMYPGDLKDNPLRFTGDTYLLINGGSYSASVILASIMKDYGFATLIGEETGQPANPYGGNYFFDLPNTHLRSSVPTGRCYRPSGLDTNRGVIPDFEIKRIFNNITAPKDTVMEFTKELIKKTIKGRTSL